MSKGTTPSGSGETGKPYNNTRQQHICPICDTVATKRCSRCKRQWYCTADHQRQHWRDHRVQCTDIVKADDYTSHKKEFDRIVQKYQLNSESKSNEIAEYLTTASTTPPSPTTTTTTNDDDNNGNDHDMETNNSNNNNNNNNNNNTSATDAEQITAPSSPSEQQEQVQQHEQKQEHSGMVVSPIDFAEKFGMTVSEAVLFLGWIKVGVTFKEQSIDVAKRSGFGK
jgi:hypothetical protein